MKPALECGSLLPPLRLELARGAAVALTFRSARWEEQEDADLKVGATKRQQAAALQRGGQDFHLPQGSRFFELFSASDTIFPCFFKGLEECWGHAGERMCVAY